jgi:hypothetical protein
MSRDSSALTEEEGRINEQKHGNAAGYGSKRLYTDCGDNVGKGHLPAGADSNLRRPAEIGTTEVGRRILV